MKKYFFGLSAIVLAIAFSAFTKPAKFFATERFQFQGAVNDQSQVENPALWTLVPSANCTNSAADDEACEIVVNDIYYRTVGGEIVLNTTDPDGSGTGDQQMVIAAGPGQDVNDYIVISTGTTATSIFNVETP